MSDALAPCVSLASLAGTWRRRWIRWPDGRQDGTTSVFWVQAGRYYGDLRIPAAEAPAGGPEGFAGELAESAGLFHWRRDVDLCPTGRPDAGRLRYLGEGRRMMVEEGALEPYTELWERAGAPSTPAVTRLDHGMIGHGWFVATGEHFVLATRRPETGVEVSYGRRDRGGSNGTILASSAPWRKGRRAFEGDALAEGWAEIPV